MGRGWDATHQARVPGAVHEPGTITVPAATLVALLAALPAGPVDLATAGVSYGEPVLELSSGRTRYRLQTVPDERELAAWGPELPALGSGYTTADPEALAAAVARLAPFAQRKVDNPEDTWAECLLFGPNGDNGIVLHAATRDHAAETTVPSTGPRLDVLVPARPLAKALEGMGGTAELWQVDGLFYVADRAGRRAAIRTHGLESYPSGATDLLNSPARPVHCSVQHSDLQPVVDLAALVSDRCLLVLSRDGLVVASQNPSKGEPVGEYADVVPGMGAGNARLTAPVRTLQHALAALQPGVLELITTPGGRRLLIRDEPGNAVGLQTLGA